MTQSKKKADCGHHVDRISNLPCNVIDGILKHFNIQDLVRTSILSRKWRYNWISVPQLVIGEKFFDICKRNNHTDSEISRFITQVLLLHDGPVYKFTLRLPIDFGCRIDFLEKLILLLSKSGIKDLELENHNFIALLPYQVPSYVFFLKELTNFRLYLFELSVPPNFCGLKKLLDLKLEQVTFESGGLESLISGCPLLETLTISLCSGFECIDLSGPTLKVVRIGFEDNVKSISLKNAENLIDLTLVDHRETEDESVKVSGLIKSLPKLQRLVMRANEFKVLSASGVIPQTLLESFSSLDYLKIVGNGMNLSEREGLLYIFSVLKSTPNLVQLIIKSRVYDDVQEPDQPEELESDGCCLDQLRTVKIVTGYKVKHALSLIRFILANCPSLETLSFDIALDFRQGDALMMLRISQDLLRMKRVSQKVQVEFTQSYK